MVQESKCWKDFLIQLDTNQRFHHTVLALSELRSIYRNSRFFRCVWYRTLYWFTDSVANIFKNIYIESHGGNPA